MSDTPDAAVADTLCTLRVHRPALFDAVAGAKNADHALDALGRTLALTLLGGEADVAARLQFALYGIGGCDFTYPAPEKAKAASLLKPLKFKRLRGDTQGKEWMAEGGIHDYVIAENRKGNGYILEYTEVGESDGRKHPGTFETRKAAKRAAKKHRHAAIAKLFKRKTAKEVLAGPAAPQASAASEVPALRVKPLEFEEMGGINGDFLMAETDLRTYEISEVEDTGEYTLTLGESSDQLPKMLKPFPNLAAAMKAANEQHVAQVSKLLEPEDAKRTKASLRLLEDALTHIPDEIDINRLIKAPKESSRHADIAKRIAAHLAPALAAVELFQNEMETTS